MLVGAGEEGRRVGLGILLDGRVAGTCASFWDCIGAAVGGVEWRIGFVSDSKPAPVGAGGSRRLDLWGL